MDVPSRAGFLARSCEVCVHRHASRGAKTGTSSRLLRDDPRDTTPLLRRLCALGLKLSLASNRIGVDPKRAVQRRRLGVYSFDPLASSPQPRQHRQSPLP